MKDLKKLTKEFFKKKWTDLHGNLNDIEGSKCPGVYALAYTKENLSGQKVQFKDIHYFGMSNSAIVGSALHRNRAVTLACMA